MTEAEMIAWSKEPFHSQDALQVAMQDPAYKSPYSDFYRQCVAAKLAITEKGSVGVATKATRNSIQVGMNTGPTNAEQAEAANRKALGAVSTDVAGERDRQARVAAQKVEDDAVRAHLENPYR